MPPKARKSAKKDADEGENLAELFKDMVFVACGKLSTTQAVLKDKIQTHGGKFVSRVDDSVTHVVVGSEDRNRKSKIDQAKKLCNARFVKEEFVTESIDNGKLASVEDFKCAEFGSGEPPAKKAKTDDDDSEEEEEENKKGEDKKKVVVKGKAAVDQYVPDGSNKTVYQEPDCIWDCMLNQTNIAGNNNKFYVIQLLVEDSTKQYYLWNRWGRVGDKGMNKLEPCTSLDDAKNKFQKKFRDKTGNNWYSRDNFVSRPGKYTLIAIDYGADEEPVEEETVENGNGDSKNSKESKLDPHIQDLINLIFDMKMMESVMTEFDFDPKKQPLGKLTKDQIKKGYLVLKEIEKIINNNSAFSSSDRLAQLSSEFYTLIPHNFGRMRPPIINSSEMLKKKLRMVESLADIEIAVKVLQDKGDSNLSAIDANYKKLHAELKPLEETSDEYKTIARYINNTYPRGTPKIKTIFSLKREGEAERFEQKKSLGNRRLLWHGSRLTNFVGILSQGLRIAPPEAPCSGYRFGKGIYFADICGFSANYCRSYGQKDFLMLLGDVALGKTADLNYDQYMEKPIAGTNSTKALGTEEPDPKDDVTLPDGCVVPTGRIVPSGYTNVSCREHQYIVYDVSQVELKYLIHFEQTSY